MNISELKPCPFCGKLELTMMKRNPFDDIIFYWIECEIIGCRKEVSFSEEGAIEDWAIEDWNYRYNED